MKAARGRFFARYAAMPAWVVLTILVAASLGAATISHAAPARLLVIIDKSQQAMQVSIDGWRWYVWRVSTARRGYRTPTGTFRPIRLERIWYSTKYDFAPMPNSIFFLGGYAIHGTTEVRNLGRPVSHGCVRLHPDNARRLFSLVKRYGRAATKIVIRP
jgi:lipoprotein-anchoring transpeptidase ErfK/SrfK